LFKNPPIIFIYKGNLPQYVYDSLDYNNKTNYRKIILICDLKIVNKKKIDKKIKIYDYKKFDLNIEINLHNKKINEFRSGFWLKTIERYFILLNFVKFFNINEFYHAELDNLFSNLNNLHKKLNKIGKYFYLTTVNQKKQAFGSVIYINQIKILENFCTFIEEKLQKKFYNDMELLYLFAKKNNNKIKYLPTFLEVKNKSYANYKDLGGIFDNLNLGVYIFGTDPRNHARPIYNRENLYQNKKTEYILKNSTFNIKKNNFFLTLKNKKFKLYNIHIHSKLVRKFFLKKQHMNLLKNFNKGQQSLISLNILNILKLNIFDFKILRIKKYIKYIIDKKKLNV
jgi:hypothetical protein